MDKDKNELPDLPWEEEPKPKKKVKTKIKLPPITNRDKLEKERKEEERKEEERKEEERKYPHKKYERLGKEYKSPNKISEWIGEILWGIFFIVVVGIIVSVSQENLEIEQQIQYQEFRESQIP